MDREAWRDTAHGLAKNQTKISTISMLKKKKKKTNGIKMFRSGMFMIEKYLRK